MPGPMQTDYENTEQNSENAHGAAQKYNETCSLGFLYSDQVMGQGKELCYGTNK
jgi:hypothetical protein